ncbi:BZ3500_MvSof-1268-A1-R1_Chr1-3g02491 [Microbotryum saponariae]|uniref:BZ3500_MvSof-1268-A1-R1_Chr1-3g02491 protein n=1 Tax=Microbotryum saponariae TaxID=289078 RepID=A0A2X0KHD5_9BASI|nr:BZ3500_MvSof-1268-A1-R1_Chr1-3g02491 [Microbotryum saponariae]SCZ96388.1 BZ3501_MvSof-1269-A2-R1_Chr1-3g02094 [Microbotryum saponariae]
MQLFTFLIAAAPALTSFVSASALTADETAVEKRNLYKYCCNGKLWKRDDAESLEKRTFCLRKRNLWIYKCPATPPCNPLTCPKPPNSLPLCTDNQCDFKCLGGTIKVGSSCVKRCSLKSCPAVANATPVCKDDQSCDFNCNSGFNEVDGKCVPACDPTKCPVVANATPVCNDDQSCDFNCNSGFNEVDGKCVPNCDPTKCPVVANSQSICTSSGDCDFNCNSGFSEVNGKCVPDTPTCDVTKCPNCPNGNGTPICNSAGKCDLKCNPGYKNVDGSCVPIPATCTKKSVAFYDNFQSTADGDSAVTVASIDACAAYCMTKNCASFDFWDGNQCGIQIGGGGFDGFQYSPGVVHGVPGQCSDYTNKCPEKVAVKACYNKSVCPSTSARLRRSHPAREH